MEDNKKQILKKFGVAGLSAALVFSTGVGISLTNGNDETYANKSKKGSTGKKIEKSYPNLVKKTDYGKTMSKDETTYVVLDADGNEKEVVVDEWLRNGKNKDKVEDYSNLSNIENTAGHEKFKRSGNDLTWDADGEDIHYQGRATSGLPVNVEVSYYLDGQKMSADEISGKSGRVEIRFDYKVNHKNNVSVDGKNYHINHPYTMASGVVLSNSHFRNISVNGGKSMNDGSNSIVLGIGFPGLQEDLNISKSKIDIPDHVSIKADCKNFKLDGTYTVAMSGIFGDLDEGALDNIERQGDTLADGVDKLGDASSELVKGSDKLSDATGQLVEGVNDLGDGSEKLYDGSQKLVNGINAFNSGSQKLMAGSSQVLSGMEQLQNGLGQLSGNSDQLRAGAKQIQDKIFEMASKEAGKEITAENYKELLGGYAKAEIEKATKAAISDPKNLSEADAKVRAGLSQQGVTDTLQQNMIIAAAYDRAVADGQKSLSQEQIGSYLKSEGERMQKEVAGLKKSAALVQSAVADSKCKAAAVEFLKSQPNFNPKDMEKQVPVVATAVKLAGGNPLKVQENIPAAKKAVMEAMKLKEMSNVDKTAVAAKVKGFDQLAIIGSDKFQSELKEGKKKLEQTQGGLAGVVQFVDGLNQYTAGVDKAYQASKQLTAGMTKVHFGISELGNGTAKLKEGAVTLNSGLKTLNSGVSKLSSGAEKINTGAGELFKGMNKFDKEGVKKMTETLNESEIKTVTGRMKAVRRASADKIFIGGKNSNMPGESKIVYKTGEIK